MKLLKWVGCFIIMTTLIMMVFVLGGAEVFTEAFGWGLLTSMGIGLIFTLYFKEEGYL